MGTGVDFLHQTSIKIKLEISFLAKFQWKLYIFTVDLMKDLNAEPLKTLTLILLQSMQWSIIKTLETHFL